MGVKCVLALTATATKSTCRNIAQHLQISSDGVVGLFKLPSNLVLTASKELDRDAVMNFLLRLTAGFPRCWMTTLYSYVFSGVHRSNKHCSFKALIALLKSDRFSACSSIIVYTTRRDETERLAALIRISMQHKLR